MRLATKNEILILLGGCVPLFAAHCISAAGATTKFLFDNATSFDLDSDLVSGMILQLNTAGIVDGECLGRFAAFGAVAPEPTVTEFRTYRSPVGDPVPAGAVAVADTTDLAYQIITVEVTT